jgi:hypothetical protein
MFIHFFISYIFQSQSELLFNYKYKMHQQKNV